MYCRNCGKSVDDRAVACMSCGVAPANGHRFCQSCGRGDESGRHHVREVRRAAAGPFDIIKRQPGDLPGLEPDRTDRLHHPLARLHPALLAPVCDGLMQGRLKTTVLCFEAARWLAACLSSTAAGTCIGSSSGGRRHRSFRR